jgi:hypothetical protein
MAEHFLPVVLVEIGVLSKLRPHLLGIQFVPFAKGLNIDAAGGNAMFGEEALGTLHSSFSEDLLYSSVPRLSAWPPRIKFLSVN